MVESIKDQIASLNKEVNEILANNNELSPESLESVSNAVKDSMAVPMSELSSVNSQLANIDFASVNSSNVLVKAENSMNDLGVLLETCKGIMNHIYSQIASLDIADAKMIEATASFVNAMKDSMQSFIDLYRDEKQFLNTIALKRLDFENKKALMKYKFDLENSKNTINGDDDATITYSQENLMKFISEQEEQ